MGAWEPMARGESCARAFPDRGRVDNIAPDMIQKRQPEELNVLGGPLEVCGLDPRTGFFRDGCCRTGPDDLGVHVVCTRVTDEFLEFSRQMGNDLITPIPEYQFPGLKPGDQWCLCAARWAEALDAGAAPQVVLTATHARALDVVPLADLQAHAVAE